MTEILEPRCVTTELSGWGRFSRRSVRMASPRDASEIAALARIGGLIARGSGRAYGDSAIGTKLTLDMRRMNRMLAFDEATGQLTAEAGVLLSDVIATFLPRGWFPYVTPGTKFVTLGGAIAADVHGKNHHRNGSFGAFVDWIDVLGADGEIARISPDENSEMFEWTLGGMGLTGVIVRAAFRLRRVGSGWIRKTTVPAANLADAMAAFETADEALYSVGWIDCLARGASLGRTLVMTGEHADANDLPRGYRAHPFKTPVRRRFTFPFDAPGIVLNRFSIRAFNALYWQMGLRAPRETLVDYDSFFYPLDRMLGWNRIYGRRGFLQFQCALPLESAGSGLTRLLTETAQAGQGSFLAVLKRLGAQQSRFSFPMEGYTLALDFPATPTALALLKRLDAIVIDHGGRFYLAKDARMSSETLCRSDARIDAFRDMRRMRHLEHAFSSDQSQRFHL